MPTSFLCLFSNHMSGSQSRLCELSPASLASSCLVADKTSMSAGSVSVIISEGNEMVEKNCSPLSKQLSAKESYML